MHANFTTTLSDKLLNRIPKTVSLLNLVLVSLKPHCRLDSMIQALQNTCTEQKLFLSKVRLDLCPGAEVNSWVNHPQHVDAGNIDKLSVASEVCESQLQVHSTPNDAAD